MSTMAQSVKSFVVDLLRVRVYPTQDELVQDAAREVQSYFQQVFLAQGRATAVLATGNSQLKFLEQLVRLGGVDWSKITLFHMDEYLGIPADHSASFGRYMRERVAQLVKPKVFQYLEGDSLLPIRECERYTQLLRAQAIDLCCLGIGENGHLAFNDPPVADFHDNRSVKIVKLDDACKRQQVGEGHFPNPESVPPYAFTLSIPALCSAKKMICIVPEKRKAEAVKAALYGPITTACPASILRTQAHCLLFLDAESASLL
jgi:glucosamine-6-phosphate deaminase